MRTFFNGWRRRAGCTTLLFALAIMGVWLRSLRIHDEWKPWQNNAVVYVTASENGRLVFGRVYRPRMLVTGPFTESETNIPIINQERMISGVVFKKDWEVNRYLFSLEKRSHFWWNVISPAITIELEFLVIPYSSIVLPLSLLSAYLILWMPRKRS